MAKTSKTRASLATILSSCSEDLFPAEMGRATIHIDSRGSDGDTPLHVVLWREDAHAALTLIEADADVNAIGDMSETPLHLAMRKGDIEVIEAMLNAGADISLVSEFGQTPKDIAKAQGGAVMKVLKTHRRSLS